MDNITVNEKQFLCGVAITGICLIIARSVFDNFVIGSVVFWSSYVLNPFAVAYIVKYQALDKQTVLVILCSGFFNHYLITIVLVSLGIFSSNNVLLVLLMEAIVSFVIATSMTSNESFSNSFKAVTWNLPSKQRILANLAILASGFLFIGFAVTGLYGLFEPSKNLSHYFNPVTLLIITPISVGVYLLLDCNIGKLEAVTLYLTGSMVIITPFILFGPIWANDTFYYHHLSQLLRNGQMDAYTIGNIVNYPGLSFFVLAAMGNEITNSIWFYFELAVFSYTIMYGSVAAILRIMGKKAQLLGLLFFISFPTIISYFSQSRPYEFASALLCLAVFIVLDSAKISEDEHKTHGIWLWLLAIIAISAHVYGSLILLVIIARITVKRSSGNSLMNQVYALLPMMGLFTILSLPMSAIPELPYGIDGFLFRILNMQSRASPLSSFLASLPLQSELEIAYSIYENFYLLAGFILGAFALFLLKDQCRLFKSERKARIFLWTISIQFLALWLFAVSTGYGTASERLGTNIGWVISSIGPIWFLYVFIYHCSKRGIVHQILTITIIFMVSFGMIVGYSTRMSFDDDNWQMVSFVQDEIPIEAGIAASETLQKVLYAFGHLNVRTSVFAFRVLLNSNFTFSDVKAFAKSGYPQSIDFVIDYLILSDNHVIPDLNQTMLLECIESSQYFVLIGSGETWSVFNIILD